MSTDSELRHLSAIRELTAMVCSRTLIKPLFDEMQRGNREYLDGQAAAKDVV